MDPVTLGLCSQIDLDIEVERSAKNRPIAETGDTLLPAATTENLYRPAPQQEEELDADKVFAKLSALKGNRNDEDDDQF
jgi:uncharacterized protein